MRDVADPPSEWKLLIGDGMDVMEAAYGALALSAAGEIEKAVGPDDYGWSGHFRHLAAERPVRMRIELHTMLKNAADALAKSDERLAARLRQQCQILDGMPKRVGG
jgi:hypothetical protein